MSDVLTNPQRDHHQNHSYPTHVPVYGLITPARQIQVPSDDLDLLWWRSSANKMNWTVWWMGLLLDWVFHDWPQQLCIVNSVSLKFSTDKWLCHWSMQKTKTSLCVIHTLSPSFEVVKCLVLMCLRLLALTFLHLTPCFTPSQHQLAYSDVTIFLVFVLSIELSKYYRPYTAESLTQWFFFFCMIFLHCRKLLYNWCRGQNQ